MQPLECPLSLLRNPRHRFLQSAAAPVSVAQRPDARASAKHEPYPIPFPWNFDSRSFGVKEKRERGFVTSEIAVMLRSFKEWWEWEVCGGEAWNGNAEKKRKKKKRVRGIWGGKIDTDPDLGENAFLLESARNEGLQVHHLPSVFVHLSFSLARRDCRCSWRRGSVFSFFFFFTPFATCQTRQQGARTQNTNSTKNL